MEATITVWHIRPLQERRSLDNNHDADAKYKKELALTRNSHARKMTAKCFRNKVVEDLRR